MPKRTPINTPGIYPAQNSFTTDTFAMTPYTIMGMLGGMMGPMEPAEAVNAHANSLSYPRSIISGIRIAPIIAAAADAEPKIAAMNIQEIIVVNPNPPGIQPKIQFAKRTIFLDSWPRFIISPANINSGIAISVKLFKPEYIR